MKSGCQSNIFKLDEALREVDGYLLVTEYLYPNMSMRESCDSRRHVQAGNVFPKVHCISLALNQVARGNCPMQRIVGVSLLVRGNMLC